MTQPTFKLDFIGFAASRSGTTWLSKCLAEHPEICFSSEKEVHFFDKDFNYRQGLSHYQTYFAHCDSNKIIGEYTPSYYKYDWIAQRIAADFPDVKLIACLRDPIGRAFSNYLYNKKQGKDTKYDKFIDMPINHHHFVKGRYFECLRPYLKLFPREQIFITTFEEMLARPDEVVSQVYDFLGVDSSFEPPFLRSKVNQSALVANRLMLLAKVTARRHVIKASPLGNFLVRAAKKIGLRPVLRKIHQLNRKTVSYIEGSDYKNEKLEAQARVRFLPFLIDDIKKLEKFLDKDLSVWKSVS